MRKERRKGLAHSLFAEAIFCACALFLILFAALDLNETVYAAGDGSSHATALTTKTKTLTGGDYYLSGDITATSKITVNGSVNLCLNGYTLTLSGTFINVTGTLNVYDCGEGGRVARTDSAEGNMIYCVMVSGTLNLYGGEIYSSAVGTTYSVNNYGTVKVFGGKITACGNNSYGVYNYGNLYLAGGILSGESAAIYAANKNIYGCADGTYFSGSAISVLYDTPSDLLAADAISEVDEAAKDDFVLLSDEYCFSYDADEKCLKVVVYTPPHEHSYQLTSQTPSTCVEQGSNIYTCACGDVITEELPLAAHAVSRIFTSLDESKSYFAFDTVRAEEINILCECDVCGNLQVENVAVSYLNSDSLRYGDEYVVVSFQAGGNSYRTSCIVTVNKKPVSAPAKDDGVFTYDGTEKQYKIAESGYYTATNTTRTSAGSQTVTVSLNDKQNYCWQDAESTDAESTDEESNDLQYLFTVEKAIVETPVLDGKSYTGARLRATVPGSSLYKVTENDGGINAGKYKVVLTLKDSDNYKWHFCDGESTEVYFFITIADNAVFDAQIADYVCGEEASTPTASALFGQVEFSYGANLDDEFTSDAPTTAGVYYLKAYVAGTENYSYAAEYVKFKVTGADGDDDDELYDDDLTETPSAPDEDKTFESDGGASVDNGTADETAGGATNESKDVNSDSTEQKENSGKNTTTESATTESTTTESGVGTSATTEISNGTNSSAETADSTSASGEVSSGTSANNEISVGTSDKVSDGTNNEIYDGTDDKISDGTDDKISDDNSNKEIADGTNKEIADGTNNNEILDGSSNNEIADGAGEEISNGTDEEIADGAGDEIADGTGEELADGAGDGYIIITDSESTSSSTLYIWLLCGAALPALAVAIFIIIGKIKAKKKGK
jgi:hypothetical protein